MSAEAENPFSYLKLIKTHSRIKLLGIRLFKLLIFSIHSAKAESFEFKKAYIDINLPKKLGLN